MMKLNAEQAAAAESRETKLVCIAGPGSGKTRTLIARHGWLAGQWPASKIALVTYTNAAANEIKERIKAEGLPEPGYVGTLHGLMLWVIHKYGPLTLGCGRLTVVDDETSLNLIKTIVAAMPVRVSLKLAVDACKVNPMLGGVVPAGLLPVAGAYHQRMMENGLVDYDGVLTTGLKVMKTLPTELARDWPLPFLLVDELQDCSEMDFQIYRAWPSGNVFAVGDPDQAIYGFRGGKPEIITTLAGVWPVVKLESSYRHTPDIAAAANRLIAHNAGRVDKTIKPVCGGAGEITATGCPDELAERAALAGAIQRWRGLGMAVEEMAVLCRTNFAVQNIADYLRGMGLKVKARERADLPPDWNDCRRFVGFLANPNNNHLAHYVLTRMRGAEAADAARRDAVANYSTINDRCLHVSENMPAGAVPEALARANFSAAAIDRVNAAMTVTGPDATVEYLALALAEEEHNGKEEGEGITVTTIHAAKGREWDCVLLPGWYEGGFPKDALRASEEERRLAFVAITRARKAVLVTWPESAMLNQWRRTPTTGLRPSCFVAEMGLNC